MKKLLMAMVAVAAGVAVAAPAKSGAGQPVAADYPAWTGVTAKNHIAGRMLMGPSDLRQRVGTIVIEIDAEKADEQFEATGGVSAKNGLGSLIGHGSTSWETLEALPRDVMVVYVVRNMKDRDAVIKAMKAKNDKDGARRALGLSRAPVYENVTFEGAPDSTGKLPFYYVMGYEGKEPVASGTFDAKSAAAINKAISSQKAKLSNDDITWRKFYGYVSEPKYFKDLEKALKKPPLGSCMTKIKKGVTAKEPEKAKEAQILYDALEQAKSELVFTAMMAAGEAPHVAAYKMSQVVRYWPETKRQLSAVAGKIKANKEAKPLIDAYMNLATWADPDFTCKNAGEVKKIIGELNKMKNKLNALKESKNVKIQNGALILDGMIDEVISIIPTKAPQK